MELVTTGPGNEALMSESSEVKTQLGVGMLSIEKMWARNVCASMSQKQTQLASLSLYWGTRDLQMVSHRTCDRSLSFYLNLCECFTVARSELRTKGQRHCATTFQNC